MSSSTSTTTTTTQPPPQYVTLNGNTARKLCTLADWDDWHIGINAFVFSLNAISHFLYPEPYRETDYYNYHISVYQPTFERCGEREPEPHQIEKRYGPFGWNAVPFDSQHWKSWAEKERLVRSALLTTIDSALLKTVDHNSLWSTRDIYNAVGAALHGPGSWFARKDNRRRLEAMRLDSLPNVKTHFDDFEQLAAQAQISDGEKVVIFRRGLLEYLIRAEIEELYKANEGAKTSWLEFSKMYKAGIRNLITRHLSRGVKLMDLNDDFLAEPKEDTASN